MKSTVFKLAFGCTAIALLTLVVSTKSEREEYLLLASTQTVTERIHEKHEQDVRTTLQAGVDEMSFPKIQNRIPRALIESTDSALFPACPFTSTASQFVFDFTNKGTIPTAELFLYANKSAEHAVRKIDKVYLSSGNYSVQLASLNHSETEQDGELMQQWYLELFTKEDVLVYTTPKTHDMEYGEVGTVEIVDSDARITKPVYTLRVVHGAFQDTETQSVAPLCALFTLNDTSALVEKIALPRHTATDSMAAALVERTSHIQKPQETLQTSVTLFIVLLGMLAVFLIFIKKSQIR